MTDPSPRTIGRYVLYDEIAAGGMATVHFGRLSGPVGFSRAVAIKRLHANYAKDPEFVAMFLDEARLAARIRHPNVVQALDVVATSGEVFLVMEYVAGEALSRLTRALKSRGQIVSHRIAVAVLTGVLHGLHAAHEARDEAGSPLNIVHRDVSPQNVIVGVDGVARVLDFGVAKAAGRLQATRDGGLKGKISYMAPEHLSGGDVTRRSDIYSAGVIFWELLTGQRLYEGDSEAALLAKVLAPATPAPSSLNPQVPAFLDAIVLKALALDAKDRYATAREMALDLEKHAGLVSTSDVTEWVETLAKDVLTQRAHRVSEIERSTSDAHTSDAQAHLASLDPPRPEEWSEPSLRTPSSKDARSELPTLVEPSASSLTRAELSVPSRPHAPKRTARTIGIAAALCLLLVATFFLGRSRPTLTSSAAGGESAAPSSDPPHPSASSIPFAASSASASSSASATPLATASASSSSSATPLASSSASASPSVHVVTRAPADCDPPFVYKDGYKVYKRNCL